MSDTTDSLWFVNILFMSIWVGSFTGVGMSTIYNYQNLIRFAECPSE